MSAFLRLANPPAASEPSNVADRFHTIGRILPASQELVTVGLDQTVRSALELMSRNDFSQVPVMERHVVHGVFSYRSLARTVATLHAGKHDPMDATVEEAMDIANPSWFVQVGHELRDVLDRLDQHDAVLVGDSRRLQGIMTTIDVLRYLHRVSIRYVHLEEIELTIRALLRSCMSAEEIENCARLTLCGNRTGPPPTCLEDMSFHDYVQIVRDGRMWDKCVTAFGGNRDRTRVKLEAVADLRNVVFHFKRPLTDKDDQVLESTRNWLRVRAENLDVRNTEGRTA